MSTTLVFRVLVNGPRPPFGDVADHIWGEGADIDSDGNSEYPADNRWTELTLEHRRLPNERVDVDPVSSSPLVLKVTASNGALARRVAEFLRDKALGRILE